MKLFILPVTILITIFWWQESIYNIEVEPVEGGSAFSLSLFAGKKIVITTISSANPDTVQLRFLDSLQNADTSLKVIAVPSIDLSEPGSDEAIANLKAGLSLSFTITRSAMVKKSAGSDQQPLLKWLTDVNENSHFDIDAEATGQLFIVSSTGILYSVLKSDVPAEVLTKVLNQNVNQE